MATWQQGINSGGFLAGIGGQNENAPRLGDVNATLGMIRENNDIDRSGANNVGLTALRGLAGVADMYSQEQQQKALGAFNQVHANAWATGDNSGLIKFAQENPAFVAQAQQAFSGIDEQKRNEMGDLAMRANVALSQGPEVYSKFIADNKDKLNRVGANADWMIQTGVQNPEQLSHMLTTMSLGALGTEKAFAVQDKMVGRQQEQQRINETIRNNDMTNARGIRGQNIARANALTSAYAPTSDMKNYSQYTQMLKTDPEGAKAFASAAGINPNQKKLFKVEEGSDGGIIKYYSDGTEERGNINQQVSFDGMKSPISVPQAYRVMDKSTEGAKSAAGFAYRIRSNIDEQNNLIARGELSPQRAALINRALGDGTIANLNLSPAEQVYIQKGQDSIMAVLRKESGAAIPDTEMARYYKIYFPMPGDSERAIKAKSSAMENQYKSIRAQAGRAYDALTVLANTAYADGNQSSATNQQPAAKQPAVGSFTSKSGIQFTVE